MEGTLREPEVIKPPQLLAAEFLRLADKTFKVTVRAASLWKITMAKRSVSIQFH
jgi:hypothetical protein